MNRPLRFNRRVSSDLRDILDYYEAEDGRKLADLFFGELVAKLRKVEDHPEYFHFQADDQRRADLDRFPYPFLYRIKPGCIRILVIGHNRRHPSFGIRRH